MGRDGSTSRRNISDKIHKLEYQGQASVHSSTLIQFYNEVAKNNKTKGFIDNYLHFFPKLKKEEFAPKGESIKEYFLLQRTLGKGESACMVYCRDNQDVLGSSNLRDINSYCLANNITYLTTIDFLYYAYCRKKMTGQECAEFMQAVNDAGSKLPMIDITQYVCTVQI